jgi:lysophospholipase L1-like esterase
LISGNFTWNTGMPALMGNSGAYCGYLSFLAGNGMGCGFNSVSFMTDAPKIGIGIYGGGGTSATVLVDDQYVMGPGDIITTVGYPEYVVLDYASSGTGTRARKVTVEFQGGNSNSWGAAVAPQYSVWPVAFTGDRIRAVFEGDSLTGGGGGFPVLPNGDWPGIASKLLGISDPWNVAQGSTGYCTAGSYQTFGQRIQNVTSANPDIVIVSGGTNDEGAGYTPTQIQACVTTYLQNLRAALPATPIIVQGVWPQATGPSAQRIATENAISAAVTAVADSLIYFVPVSTATPVWSSGTGNVTVQTGTGQSDIYTAPDGSHITEAGIDVGNTNIDSRRSLGAVDPLHNVQGRKRRALGSACQSKRNVAKV